MNGLWTVARREFGSFFRLPLGWVTIALYLFMCGLVCALAVLVPGQPASLRAFFSVSYWLLLPVAPAVSMRLMSEELRTGTIESLVTAPLNDFALVIGKYLGAAAFVVVMIAPTLVYPAVLAVVSPGGIDAGPVVSGYAALLLLGMMYLAVGVLVSSLTSNQTLAFLGTLFTLLLMLVATGLGIDAVPLWARGVLAACAIQPRIADFAKGVIETGHVVFFLSVSAYFVLLAGVVMQSRRWR